jgi:hydroxyacylglutathione hydrolase
MIIKSFPVNPFEMNCYVCHDEKTGDGIIVDPAAYTDSEKEAILDYIDDTEISIKSIVNTHGHLDHILGNKWASEMFHVPLMMHKNDLLLVTNAVQQATMFGIAIPQPPPPDKFIEEADELTVGQSKLKIIHTPGHSPGSICLIDEEGKNMVVGDCVFRGSIGRVDLWRGNMDELLSSIKNEIFKIQR